MFAFYFAYFKTSGKTWKWRLEQQSFPKNYQIYSLYYRIAYFICQGIFLERQGYVWEFHFLNFVAFLHSSPNFFSVWFLWPKFSLSTLAVSYAIFPPNFLSVWFLWQKFSLSKLAVLSAIFPPNFFSAWFLWQKFSLSILSVLNAIFLREYWPFSFLLKLSSDHPCYIFYFASVQSIARRSFPLSVSVAEAANQGAVVLFIAVWLPTNGVRRDEVVSSRCNAVAALNCRALRGPAGLQPRQSTAK